MFTDRLEDEDSSSTPSLPISPPPPLSNPGPSSSGKRKGSSRPDEKKGKGTAKKRRTEISRQIDVPTQIGKDIMRISLRIRNWESEMRTHKRELQRLHRQLAECPTLSPVDFGPNRDQNPRGLSNVQTTNSDSNFLADFGRPVQRDASTHAGPAMTDVGTDNPCHDLAALPDDPQAEPSSAGDINSTYPPFLPSSSSPSSSVSSSYSSASAYSDATPLVVVRRREGRGRGIRSPANVPAAVVGSRGLGAWSDDVEREERERKDREKEEDKDNEAMEEN